MYDAKSRGGAKRTKRLAITAAAIGAAVVAIMIVLFFLARDRDAGVEPEGRPAAVVAASRAGDAGSDDALVTPDDLLTPLDDMLAVPTPEMKAGAQASLAVPPHPWHLSARDRVAADSIEELIAKIGNIDDYSQAATSVGSFSAGSLSTNLLPASMIAVRRLLEEGRADPAAVVPAARAALREAVEGWEAVTYAFEVEESRATGRRNIDEACEHWQFKVRQQVLPYLLAELGDHESMPIIMQVAKGPDWVDPSWPRWPTVAAPWAAPGALPLYALHTLIQSYPESGLSPEARRLRDEYLAAAVVVPEARTQTVTSWRAAYSEGDIRFLPDPQNRAVLAHQPTMEVRIWPVHFTDGKEIANLSSVLHERTRELYGMLEAFIIEAFPDYQP